MLQLCRLCLFGAALLAGQSPALAITPQAKLDEFAKTIGYRFTLLGNKVVDGCPDKPVQLHCYSATLDLTTPKGLPAGDWSIYSGSSKT